jgi:hypothetical protein
MGFLIKLIKIDFILGFLLLAFAAWWFLTPDNLSTVEPYNQIVGKSYRTRVPVGIWADRKSVPWLGENSIADMILSTRTLGAEYDYVNGPFKLLPLGSLFYVRRIQSKAMNGTHEYLSVIVSSGPYEHRKVDTADLWPVDDPRDVISPITHRVKTIYCEEVPPPNNPASK